ncbi:MAG: hypothetical protein H6819_05400 [Phycisphaerales bacterium]|nr:hypothetical protein [Phycisphaerales bacterium]MCB9854785.1 hypothetical protein [Phycisphaerales bacterium]MCB9863743.1 hypothetical protein [Phycisphaerales bacterium]
MLLFSWGAGCSGTVPGIATNIEIPVRAVDRTSFDLSDYGLVLNRAINGEQIRPRELVDARLLLDSFFAQVSVVGPASTPDVFPTNDSKLAYILNCYSASLLRSLVSLSTSITVPERVPVGFEQRFAFHVDGQWRTPRDLHAWARSISGDDWRVELALPTVTGDGPAISNRPYLPELLDAQLDKAVRDALASPRVMRLDHGEIKQILYWRGLWTLRGRLISDYEQRYQTTDARMLNVLLEWSTTGFRRVTLNSAVGYADHPMPGDPRVPWDGVMLAGEP